MSGHWFLGRPGWGLEVTLEPEAVRTGRWGLPFVCLTDGGLGEGPERPTGWISLRLQVTPLCRHSQPLRMVFWLLDCWYLGWNVASYDLCCRVMAKRGDARLWTLWARWAAPFQLQLSAPQPLTPSLSQIALLRAFREFRLRASRAVSQGRVSGTGPVPRFPHMWGRGLDRVTSEFLPALLGSVSLSWHL